MADITLIDAVREAGSITITGTNFTATTTMVTIGGGDQAFTLVSSTEINLDDVPDATEVTVTKGEVSLTAPITGEEEPSAPEEFAEEAPVGGSEGNTGTVPISNDDVKTEQEKGPPDPVTPAVEPVPAETMKLGAKEPYPTGGNQSEV